MSRESSLIKNTAILSFGTVVPRLVNVVTLPILTGFLSKADYGTYDLVVSMVTLLLPVATLQLQAAAFRFLIDARDDAALQRSIVTNIVVVSTTISVAILVVLFLLLSYVDVISRLLICIYYLLDVVVVTLRQVARGLSCNKVYSMSVIVNSLSEGCAVVGLVMLLSAGLNGALVASVIGQTASLLTLLFGVNAVSLIDFKTLSAGITKKLVAYSWPLIPNSLSSWAISMSDRLVLTMMLGIEASAIFAVATKIPNLLGIFQSAFTLAWQENASLSSNDSDRDRYYSKTFDGVFCLLAGGLGLLIAASPLLFSLLVQGDYGESYVHMNILFIGALASCIASFLGGIYIAHMRTKEIGITTAVVAVVNLVAEIALVPLIGIFAASFAYVLSYVVLSVYRAVKLAEFQPIEFNVGKITATSVVLMGMVAISVLREPASMALNSCIAVAMFIALNKKILKKLVEKARR